MSRRQKVFLGGPVASRCIDSAGTVIQGFGRQVVPELMDVLEAAVSGPITSELIERQLTERSDREMFN